MGFRSWITGKEYILVDRSNGDEEVGSFPKSITIGQVKELMRNGTIDQGSYRLMERTKAGDKVLWTMSKRKQLSPEQVANMDRDKAFKAWREKTETVKKDLDDLKAFRTEMVKEFGDDTGLLQTPIELPDERMTIFDAWNRATSEGLYIGIRQNPDKVTNMMFNLGDAATNILTAIGQYAALKVSGNVEKGAKKAVRSIDKEIEEKDGKKVLTFKRKEEPKMVKDDVPQELVGEEVPPEDDIPYIPGETVAGGKEENEQ